MKKIIHSHQLLGQLLLTEPEAPAFGCAMRGKCGKCRVKLLSGLWRCDGKTVLAPAEALACRTRLISDCGEIEFTPLPRTGSCTVAWQVDEPMPDSGACCVAIDIGTTTVAAVKLLHGRVISRSGKFNSQQKYGDNVISRIGAFPEHAGELQTLLWRDCRELLDRLDGPPPERVAIAGNTVETLLFHRVDPTAVGSAPFIPPQRIFPARRDIFGGIEVLTMPSIGGFLGGDALGGLNEADLKPGEMLIDLGTNCEIVFNTGSGIVGSSAAAGPAFERLGSPALPGAVEHLYGDGSFLVIGNGEAQSLCGSALVDFLAVGRKMELLDEQGRFTGRKFPWPVCRLTEADTAELLKAKAAVFAGISALEEFTGCKAEKLCLAGGFARHLDLDNAVYCGLLPDREFVLLGNSALAAAARLAIQPERAAELEALAGTVRELPLAMLPGFEAKFIDALRLPHPVRR